MRSPPIPPDTPASELADPEGRVRVFYEVRDASGQTYTGSTFIIANVFDTYATLELEAEEAAYLGATEGSNYTAPIQVTEFVNVIIQPALPIV
jgi:hypothetical protein